jgi:fucose 4-O-acetylase-like acetyltransferase
VQAQRNETVDAAKGLAIVLVVIGHAIQRTVPGYATEPVWRTIYSFHMPLFMPLSGYVLALKPRLHDARWLGQRAVGLLVPFLVWIPLLFGGASLPFSGLDPWIDQEHGLARYALATLMNPTAGLWYLSVLFLCCAVLWATESVNHGRPSWMTAAVWPLLVALPTEAFGLGLLKWYYVFFAAGYVAGPRVRRLLGERSAPWQLAVAAAAFAAASYAGLRWLAPIDPPIVPSAATIAHYGFKAVWAVAGIAFALAFVRTLSAVRATAWLQRLGLVTLEVYAGHLLFLGLGIGEGWVRTASAAAFALLLALVFAGVVETSPPLRGLLYGRWGGGRPVAGLLVS